jgi:hypothetical protein
VVYAPHNKMMQPAVVEAPPAAPVTVVRAVSAPPATTGFAVVSAPPPSQPLAAAMAQMQSAQTGCAQADAYQNYVNSVVNTQNTANDGMTQLLQTLAANTSDPDLQSALLNASGQPNPINDALQQQLQGMASTYETICQTRMAAAQTALAQALPQQPAPAGQQQPPGASATTSGAAGSQPGTVGTQPAATPASPGAASGSAMAPGSSASVASTGTGPPCASVAATSPPPSPQAPWGPWAPLGNTGLMFDLSRVNGTTVTWRFYNAGSNTIASMYFNYSFVDADTGQQTTQSDLIPLTLAPGQSLGGWSAYTANTRGGIDIAVTQISCRQALVQAQN